MNPLKSPFRTLGLVALALTGMSILAAGCGGGGGGGGSGGGGGNTSAVSPRFAYVANLADNSVWSYAVDAASGRLTFIGATTAGTDPNSVTVDPTGQHVYVANTVSNDVSEYTIGTDGALTPMTPATVAAGRGPVSVTVDPSGQYVYVANDGSDDLSQYTIGANGALIPNAPTTAPAGARPHSVTVTHGASPVAAVPK